MEKTAKRSVVFIVSKTKALVMEFLVFLSVVVVQYKIN